MGASIDSPTHNMLHGPKPELVLEPKTRIVVLVVGAVVDSLPPSLTHPMIHDLFRDDNYVLLTCASKKMLCPAPSCIPLAKGGVQQVLMLYLGAIVCGILPLMK